MGKGQREWGERLKQIRVWWGASLHAYRRKFTNGSLGGAQRSDWPYHVGFEQTLGRSAPAVLHRLATERKVRAPYVSRFSDERRDYSLRRQTYPKMKFARRFSILSLLLWLVAVAGRADYTAVVSPGSVVVSNFDGWGTSLCWWANVVGGYANRDQYMNLAFSQLKLNIVRYNIGGGENPSGDYITSYRAVMQGFEPTNGVWNWSADANQRWILQQAVALGVNHVVAFANSPPWWMTVSGSVTGNGPSGGATDNLQTSYEDAFAAYLATVVSNLTALDGVHFDYVTALNEPAASWWYYQDPKQEGCHVDASQQARLVNYLRSESDARGLRSTGIDAAEDNSESSGVSDLGTYSGSALQNTSLLASHTYSANNASGLHSVAISLGRPMWVSEYGDGAADGMTMARRIHDDITGLGARGWVYWQVVDNAGGWGFLYNSLTTNSSGGFTTNYTINEKFYVMGQFSEFVRPGCEIISVNDANTLAAFDATNSKLTLVMVNTNTSALNVSYDLSAFTTLPAYANVYQTDDAGENLAGLAPLALAGKMLVAPIPAQSVTTFVLTNVRQSPMLLNQVDSSGTNAVTLYAGAGPALTVSAVGNEPLDYQWMSNGLAITGATNPAYLPVANTVGTNSYWCMVTNVAGAVTSAVWSVSVVQPPITSYPDAVMALQPVGYWRLNETPDNGSGNQGTVSDDYAGGNNGAYSNAVLGVKGYSPVADPAGTAANFGAYLSSNSAVMQVRAIDFSAPPAGNGEFSVAAWVKGGGQTSDAGIVAKGYGGGGEQFNLDTGSDTSPTVHGFRFFVRDALGKTHSCNSTVMPDGNWHFLAGVCDESNGAVHLLIDGVDRADASISSGSAILFSPNGSAPGASLVSIGSRAASSSSRSFTNQFAGTIGEVAIFNRALTAAQVQRLYAAAPVPALQVGRQAGGAVINYTGTLRSSMNVSGPYAPVPGAASPYNVTPEGLQMFYRSSNP